VKNAKVSPQNKAKLFAFEYKESTNSQKYAFSKILMQKFTFQRFGAISY
jgi:hypothetical protein